MAPFFSALGHAPVGAALGLQEEAFCGCRSVGQLFAARRTFRQKTLGSQNHASREIFLSGGDVFGRWYHSKQRLKSACLHAFQCGTRESCPRGRTAKSSLRNDSTSCCFTAKLQPGGGFNDPKRQQKPKFGRAASQRVVVRASSSDSATRPSTSEPSGSSWLDAPAELFKRLVHPLNDFGFGKRSIWEGGVGLFMVTGGCLFFLVIAWIKGVQLQGRTRRYEAVMEFAQACGIAVGTPVRIRGVDIGSVVALQPSLEKISVVAEIKDATIVIPRNSLVEVNQHGLISETLIDITPGLPVPKPQNSPLDEGCESEGVIVCHRQRIKGEQGVSLDELVGVCTKIAKAMDQQGVHTMFEAANRVSLAVEDAKPLIEKVNAMAGDIGPLLKELREGGVLDNLEKLLAVATEAARDLRQLNSSVLTPENTELLRQSVSTLTKTLKHVESISSDVSGLTGDPQTRYNLKQLIESLSRLISD